MSSTKALETFSKLDINEQFNQWDVIKAKRDEAWARVFAGDGSTRTARRLSDLADDMMSRFNA